MIRIGHGFDVHKFGGEGPITICGEKIDYPQGFLAHSDGDVAIHALCDAILGALAMGDIGKHFPDTASEYENIDSRILLRHVVGLAKEQGYVLGNGDVTIVAQAPKMLPHIQAMRSNLASDLNCELSQINVKATTTEKLGFEGRKEGISSHAVVIMSKAPESTASA
ncbi:MULTISPECIES: 2-C-methyl-D-erythritol 2,4-cyclodiphosphate synthase [Pseudoalteromonas]|jgi:2-C-methyl-D-erythritol 2,4-cyclodiphosphate synthase|uniref:2-C-methyl-D-erythritol 2,4-cyclodiphosphate synthase n=1 Tax=Pseudoalteromonas atlantica TaxID=288 RepID=A0ABQ0UHS7_PSEAF|nr:MULTISPECIES: 2-C-methyl-D-erythritol 2,4-cyclodiphosphate synthase [Pseudoalteromonas]MCP4058608.1 2-C-methyl-D-erythritol 2,4-cyclodiphosphate synthase [Pseudoalteromonas sp.]MDY6887171.1 2-C-methyl-D-erythritol 2,4-cyclodiphosphate synthase [Pseudomonadota bacterium]GEK77368.1 2-C-methyl-D-erythritol 2,4-cyclodiphosphate synthase [Pseudoalteromonas atlantica]ENO00446.1 2-C-methyl-D-erythritol 2,4-cyclodiphosphate synthase [Pseudoalteromonas agarivorans S816]KPW05685.1 2-C-methyl-D-erythr|tara:strand:+ start:409 stop:906 length:498 start_codon:yes stop_codon:yes gene_type:complete